MQVAEKFVSINGEGRRAGEPAVFIRFKGCNLNCSYCDTQWVNEAACPYMEMSPAEICTYAARTGIKNVTLTGGEPLLQEHMKELLRLLADAGLRAEIETNGAVPLQPFCSGAHPVFTMDCKLPGSGCEDAMICKNFACLGPDDTVKFVVSSRADLMRAEEIVRTYSLTKRCHVYVSPVFGAVDLQEIVAYMLERKLNDWRLQIQIHKVIWDPAARGV